MLMAMLGGIVVQAALVDSQAQTLHPQPRTEPCPTPHRRPRLQQRSPFHRRFTTRSSRQPHFSSPCLLSGSERHNRMLRRSLLFPFPFLPVHIENMKILRAHGSIRAGFACSCVSIVIRSVESGSESCFWLLVLNCLLALHVHVSPSSFAPINCLMSGILFSYCHTSLKICFACLNLFPRTMLNLLIGGHQNNRWTTSSISFSRHFNPCTFRSHFNRCLL